MNIELIEYSKAEVLEYLNAQNPKKFKLPKQYILSYSNYYSEGIKGIIESPLFKINKFAVRSSCKFEDQDNESNAGKYESYLNVEKVHLTDAIDKVFSSYEFYDDINQVLVQEMVSNVSMSGVVFTKDPNHGGDFFVVNYDNTTEETDTVTSGKNSGSNIYVLHRESDIFDSKMIKIIDAVKEVELLTQNDCLDIEFVETKCGDIYILQVRKLSVNKPKFQIDFKSYAVMENWLENLLTSQSHLGNSLILSCMSDWNPIELIGSKPKPLSYSLYEELITKKTWAISRNNYGYRTLENTDLMYKIFGTPYIDVRKSLNSLLPRSLSDEACLSVVNYYLHQLKKNKQLHDKIELELIPNIFTTRTEDKIGKLCSKGVIDSDEAKLYIEEMKKLTYNIFATDGFLDKDIDRIKYFKDQYSRKMTNSIENIYGSIEFVKTFGIEAFSGIARAAFASKSIIQSLVETKDWTLDDAHLFMELLSTTGKMMSLDWKNLDLKSFKRKYGHLRPGTYDICVPRYDNMCLSDGFIPNNTTSNKLNKSEIIKYLAKKIPKVYSENGLDRIEFLQSLIKSLEMREFAKFEFTKWISDSLETIAKYFESKGISREDCAFLSIEDIFRFYDNSNIHIIIKRNKEEYEKNVTVVLPEVIVDVKELTGFHEIRKSGNFITTKIVSGEVCNLEANGINRNLDSKIVLIESADPGYDFIFLEGIAGFITKYGGPNSHMAIRAFELGIPAVLGVGENMYDYLKVKKHINIDCSQRLIR